MLVDHCSSGASSTRASTTSRWRATRRARTRPDADGQRRSAWRSSVARVVQVTSISGERDNIMEADARARGPAIPAPSAQIVDAP